MHDVTRQVRAMYEKYPYPQRSPGAMIDIYPDLLLSYLEGGPRRGRLQVLDAGCGTGLVCLGTAMCNPRVAVTAIDLNRSALRQVRSEAADLGLKNLSLQEVDLMTLEGLTPPAQGYDIIVSSGVLHHLPDPQEALNRLASLLAPGGVMRVMVYNRWGRQGLYRFVAALDALYPDRQKIEERLLLGRRLMAGLPNNPAARPPFTDAHTIGDVEFVDRYLHPQDRSYSVTEFLQMAESAGLRFLRWWEPRHWSLETICPDPALRAQLADLPRDRVWTAVELLSDRPQIDLYLCRPEAQARAVGDDLAKTRVALSPQTTLRTTARMTGPVVFPFHVEVSVRDEAPRFLTGLEKAILDLGPAPLKGSQILERLGHSASPREISDAVTLLLDQEVLFRPHA